MLNQPIYNKVLFKYIYLNFLSLDKKKRTNKQQLTKKQLKEIIIYIYTN